MINLDKLESAFFKSYQDIYIKNIKDELKSKHWKSFYDNKKYEISNLKDFRSPTNNLSKGLDDATVFPEFSFKLFSTLIELVGYEFVYENLLEKNIGNSPYVLKYRDKLVDYNRLFHISWLKDLEDKVFSDKELWDSKNTNLIFCEIGGGFGSFPELIIKRHNIKFLSIDLPEANLLSTYFLNESFPDKKFFLYDDYVKNGKKITKEIINSYEIFILPPDISIADDIKIQLFINTRSMMEMNFNVISNYFNLIQNHISNEGYFLNVNRYEKRTVGSPIRIAEYPYDDKWQVIISRPSFKQEHIHKLLTKRINNTDRSDIKTELKQISGIGKKFYSSRYKRIKNFLYFKIVRKINLRLKKLLIK